MGRRNNTKHSNDRPRSRNFKRRIRNLILETLFLTILIFVAVKFLGKDGETSKVSRLDIEEQKNIIEEEMKNEQQEQELPIELAIPENQGSIKIVKAILTYDKKENQTIINFDVLNYGEKIEETVMGLMLTDSDANTLTSTHLSVQFLDQNQQTRLNIVLDGDYRKTEKIEMIEEK